MAWLAETGADEKALNPNGGAIALGHPLGSPGARLMTTLVHHMRRNEHPLRPANHVRRRRPRQRDDRRADGLTERNGEDEQEPSMDLDGITALVTGGASGLGLASARRLVRDGGHIVIMDLPSSRGKDVAEELGGRDGFRPGRRDQCR